MARRKSFKLIKDLETNFESAKQTDDTGNVNDIKWSDCFICQEHLKEKLVCPLNRNYKHKVDPENQYSNIVCDIRRFESLASISAPLKNLLRIEDVEKTCVINKAVYHKRCRSEFNDQHYERAKKRAKTNDTKEENIPSSSRKTRSTFDAKNFQSTCFLCNNSTTEQLYLVTSLEMDKKIRDSAAEMLDERLIAKLSEGDLIATESKYHKTCLAEFYNKVRKVSPKMSTEEQEKEIVEGIVIAEIEHYMKSIIEQENETIPVFYLKELKSLHLQRMKYHGCEQPYEHNTRFKEKLLQRIPELREHKMGRNIILTLKDNCGTAIFEACDLQDDGMCLERAARIIRKTILSKQNEKKQLNENDLISNETFSSDSEMNSVSAPVLSFVNMVVNGSNVVTSDQKRNSIASTIAQLLQFNTVKQKNRTKSNETPFPLYMGLMVHSRTRKKSIIEELNGFGLSISYNRILEIQNNISNQLCKFYNVQRSVCPPRLQENLFTVSAIDNLDHKPSSSTAKDSFHGTGISIFQFEPNQCETFKFDLSNSSNKNAISLNLPSYYTDVKSTKSTPSTPRISTTNSINTVDYNYFDDSDEWFSYIKNHLNDEELQHRCNWSSFFASQVNKRDSKCSSVMLPLLQDEIATHAMVRHTMDIIDRVHKSLKIDQPIIVTADQPVYAIGKQVQWLYPDEYGDCKVVMMMGPLHIEMNFIGMLGNWLESSGWTECLVKAKITTPGKAESFLSGSHPKRSRYAHQVTCAALSTLMNEAYMQSNSEEDQNSWMSERKNASSQFLYWYIVMELETLLLVLIKSLRTGNFQVFVAY